MVGVRVEGRLLLGVLAVAEVRLLLEDQGEAGREQGSGLAVDGLGDLRVMGGGQRERLGRQLVAGLGGHRLVTLDVAQDGGVLGGTRDGRHPFVVRRGGSEYCHCREVVRTDVVARRREIDHDDVDGVR